MLFFKNYYFNDFYNFEVDNLEEILNDFILKSKNSVILFSIFCFKKNIFFRFSNQIFDDSTFLDLKIDIINNIPTDWILDCLESNIRRFINTHKCLLSPMFINLSSQNPLSFHKLFSRSDFDRIMKDDSIDRIMSFQIIKNICKNKIDGFIDEKNAHLIPNELLKAMFDE